MAPLESQNIVMGLGVLNPILVRSIDKWVASFAVSLKATYSLSTVETHMAGMVFDVQAKTRWLTVMIYPYTK